MKYWNTEIVDDWLYIYSPVMENKLPFKIKRKLVEQLKEIEKSIKPLKGWVGYTELKHTHIMIMYLKFGARPYKIKGGVIWFQKELK